MTKPNSSSRQDTPNRRVAQPPACDAESPPTDQRASDPNWHRAAVFRFVGLGTELAGFTLVVAGIGYLIDSLSQNPKLYGTALGALIGFSLGMIRFIQQARSSDDN